MNLYNLLFGILLTAGLAVGVYAVGPETFMNEARSLVGMEEETALRAPKNPIQGGLPKPLRR